MDFESCVKERRSVRKFLEKPVSKEIFERIVELARYAPSWKNTQVARYHVIENAALRARVASDCVMGFEFNAKTINRAAALVVLTAVEKVSGYEKDGAYSTPKEDRWEVFDAGIAAQTFCLAAYEQGVGSVILGIFDEDKVSEVCGLPADEKVMALIAVGYPEESAKAAPARKPVTGLLTFDA